MPSPTGERRHFPVVDPLDEASRIVRGHGNAEGTSELAIALFYFKFYVTMDQFSMVI